MAHGAAHRGQARGHGDVTVTLIKDGDHRLSRPEDLERIGAAVMEVVNGGAVAASLFSHPPPVSRFSPSR